MNAGQERYMRDLRAKAWEASLTTVGDPGQTFAAAAEVYEHELRVRDSIDDASDQDYTREVRAISLARDNAYQMLDAATFGTPEHFGLQMIIGHLNEVLGPDLVREVDPEGKTVKSLPAEERKRLLDAIPDDALSPEHEQEARRLLGLGAGRKPGVFVVTEEQVREAREALEVGTPEHDAFCHEQTAKTAAEDIARGEG